MNLNFFYKPKKKSQKDEDTDLLLPQDKKAISKLAREKSKHLKSVEELNHEITLIQNSTGTLIPKFVRLHNNLRQKYRWYYNWHINPYAKTVHWFVLLLYILSLPFIYYYITASPFPQKTKATGYDFPRWEWVDPTPTGADLLSISHIPNTSSNKVAVGTEGTILFYNGSEWQSQYSGTTYTLRGVSAVDSTHIWAVGGNGLILSYSGISDSWSSQLSGTTQTLYDVVAIDQTHIWAVGTGGVILFYDGNSWLKQKDSGDNLKSIDAIELNGNYYAWAVGDGGTIFYYDGTQWSTQSSGYPSDDIRSVSILDTNNVWAATSNRIIKYNGSQWSEFRNNSANSIKVRDASYIWVSYTFTSASFYNGSTWTDKSPGIIGQLNDIYISGNNVWMVGDRGAIVHYDGNSWSNEFSSIFEYGILSLLNDISVKDLGSGVYNIVAVGQLPTENIVIIFNGTNWSTTIVRAEGEPMGPTAVYDVSFNSPNDIWVSAGVLYHYDGSGWTKGLDQNGMPGVSSNAVSMINTNLGYSAFGSAGAGYVRKFNGTKWNVDYSLAGTTFNDIFALDANNVWAVGTNGKIAYFNGSTWAEQTSNTTQTLQSISAIQESGTNYAWAAGNNGTIIYFNGSSWATQTSGYTETIENVFAQSSQEAWAAGEAVLHFDDATWSQTSISGGMHGISGVSNRIWAAGLYFIRSYYSPANATATKFAIKLPGQSFASGYDEPDSNNGVYGTPNTVQAGDNVTATIYAVDGDNVLDKGNASWAGFTTTDPNDSNPATVQLTQNGTCVQTNRQPGDPECGIGTATFVFHTTGNWTITASDVNHVLSLGTSSSISVSAGDPERLVLSNCPTLLAAGAVSGAISVNLDDFYGNDITFATSKTIALSTGSSRGKFSQSINGPWSTGSKNITIPAGSTSATFYYYDFNTGSQTITAAETPSAGWTDATCTFTINTGTLTESTLTVDKNSVRAGETLNATVTLKNNVGAALPDKTVQLTSSRNTTDATPDVFSASSQITNSDGVATFQVKPTTIGSFVLSAYDQSDSLYVPQEQTITVTSGTLAKIVLESNATEVKPGSTFYLTAKMYDGYDNIITNYTGEIKFTSSDREAKFQEANHTFSASEGGQYSQPVTLQTEGQQSITATAEGISGIVYVTVSLTATPIPTTSTPSAVPSIVITSPSPTSSPPTLLETFQESPVAQTISRILTPLTATVATLGLFPLLVQAFPQGFHILASLFPSIFTAAAARRRRKPWGLVFDSLRGKPVDLAVVRVFNAVSDRLVATKVTDQNGRFNFLLAKGKYYVTVTRSGYIFPPKISKLKANQLATRFGPQSDIYFGQSFVIGADDTNLNLNIALDPKMSTLSLGMQLLMGLKNGFDWFLITLSYFAIPLMIFGTIFAAVATIVIPSKFNLYLSSFYVLLLVAYLVINRLRSTRVGIVFNAKTRRPIIGATVLIFDKEYSAIREIKTTDQHGHFAILAQKGQYYLTVHASGYKFPSKEFKFKKGDQQLGALYFGQTIHNKKPAFVNVSIPLDKS